MSVLHNIRKRTGLLLIVITGALILFLIQGISSDGSFSGGQDRVIGEIAGEEVEQERFSAIVAQMVDNYTAQQRKAPDDFTMRGIRDQAWSRLLFEIAYKQEFEKLGIQVTEGDEDAESVDMVQGNFIDPRIKNSFKNENGEFDQSKLIQYLQQIGDASTDEQIQAAQQWQNFEKQLLQERLKAKYENLLSKSNYVTTAEAKRAYSAEQDTAGISYLYVPYSSIVDSTIEVIESEKEEYLNSHKEEFQVEEGRSFDYVVYSIEPSEKDRSQLMEKVQSIKAAFAEADDDTAFARSRADNFQMPQEWTYNQLPSQLKIDSLELMAARDSVFGPYIETDKYLLYKVIGYSEYDTIKKATASHILFKTSENNRPLPMEQQEAAKKKADEILKRALDGEDFAELARTQSEDGSAQRGGDLGEFKTGMMVEPFQEAVFTAKETGVIPRIIYSQFGFHIINVTKTAKVDELKPNLKFTVATIDKELYASKETRNIQYKAATSFWKVATEEGFEKALENDSNLVKQEAKNLAPDATGFGQVSKGRNVLTWAYGDETEIGSVSDIFRLDDYYVVAVLTGIREAGLASIEDVDEELTQKVLKQKKADKIIEILEKHQGDDFHVRMEKINESQGEGFATKNFSPVTIRYNSNYILGLGSEPAIVGTAFGMTQDKWSEKIIGENGVYIVELKGKSEASEIADYSNQKSRLLSQYGPSQYGPSRDVRNLEEVIKESADVKDYRYKFY